MEKPSEMSWSELTEPLVKAKKKIREEDVVDLVKKIRKVNLTKDDIASIKVAESDFRKGKTKNLSWSELTEPLRKAKKKIREDKVVDLVHRMRLER